MQDYELNIEAGDMMLLDALLLLKRAGRQPVVAQVCREGVCGSDAMNINGRNGLACITPLSSLKEPVEIAPRCQDSR